MHTTPARHHRLVIGSAIVLALAALYVYGWGAGIASALDALTGSGPAAPRLVTIRGQGVTLMHNVVLTAAASVVFLLLRRAACGFWFLQRRARIRTRWRLWWRSGFAYCFCMLAGFTAIDIASVLLHTTFYNYPFGTRFESSWAAVLYLVNMFFAGPTEELVLLGIVVIGLRYVDLPWWLVIIVAVGLRVPFHLYYGWAAFAIAVWPVLAVLLYRRVGMITPFIVAHGMYDVSTAMTSLNGFAGSVWPSAIAYAIMAMPAIWALVVVIRWIGRVIRVRQA